MNLKIIKIIRIFISYFTLIKHEIYYLKRKDEVIITSKSSYEKELLEVAKSTI